VKEIKSGVFDTEELLFSAVVVISSSTSQLVRENEKERTAHIAVILKSCISSSWF
jgi:hypothetical protein